MYEKAVITFIDILGFGELVKNYDYNKIDKVLNAIKEATSPIIPFDVSDKDGHAEIVSFSDSIVRVRKTESIANINNPQGIFFQELHSLVIAQAELIEFGITIRGGVTIDDIYIQRSEQTATLF